LRAIFAICVVCFASAVYSGYRIVSETRLHIEPSPVPGAARSLHPDSIAALEQEQRILHRGWWRSARSRRPRSTGSSAPWAGISSARVRGHLVDCAPSELRRPIRWSGRAVSAKGVRRMLRKWREEDLRKVEDDRTEHDAALEQIGAILAGRPAQAQGAILADLVSMWLAGWHPDVREEAFSLLQKLTRERVPVQEERARQSGSD
jgi:hypothetical protein